jgi:hypothetical protein
MLAQPSGERCDIVTRESDDRIRHRQRPGGTIPMEEYAYPVKLLLCLAHLFGEQAAIPASILIIKY